MYCRHCGKEITEDSKFCPGCGGAVSDVPAAKPQTADVAVSVSREKNEADKKKPVIFGLFFANVILAFLPFIPTLQFNLTEQGFWDKEEFWENGLGGSFSVLSLINIVKNLFNIELKENGSKKTFDSEKLHNAIGSLNVGIIILFVLLFISVCFLFSAAKKYYDKGINDRESRSEIVSYLTNASAVSLLQLVFIFIIRVLFNNVFQKNGSNPALEVTSIFIICAVIELICLIGALSISKRESDKGNNENNAASVQETTENDFWLCLCGQENPSEQKNCIKCGHLKPGEKSIIDKILKK